MMDDKIGIRGHTWIGSSFHTYNRVAQVNNRVKSAPSRVQTRSPWAKRREKVHLRPSTARLAIPTFNFVQH